MSLSRARRVRSTAEAWPGYVDMLSTLLLVVVFVLVVFVVAQFFLAQSLSGKDRALEQLNRQVAELSQLLALEQKANAELRQNVSQLSASLAEAAGARDQLAALQARTADAARDLEQAQQRIVILEGQLKDAQSALANRETLLAEQREKLVSNAAELDEERKLSAQARSQVDLLNQQMIALRQQLARLEAALQASEAKDKESQAQIADLGRRLNLALAQKVEELSRYRSEFFGRLREALGNRPDIRIVGDRFVFQSEVLFPSGSAELNDAGIQQISTLARTLNDIARTIPKDLNWVLRVDGHTDRQPIRTAQFPSNWELSSARAIAVTKYLILLGVPPERLAAAGFGEFQPLEDRGDEIAYRRNRRIELKLTER
jgi:chemotaxis protein MotB